MYFIKFYFIKNANQGIPFEDYHFRNLIHKKMSLSI